MRVVTINTYAGSLLLGAEQAEVPVELSLEDSDYGVDVQRMNFPNLRIVKDIRAWPKMHLDDYVIIAHPPCSAFSKQNNSPAKQGINAEAFQCTVNVMMYGMIQKARVIAIESVPGALDGAWEVHQKYADKYQYNVYRLMVNYCSWNSPQWRPRFWALFVRQDVDTKGEWPVAFKERERPLREVIGDDHMQPTWREDRQILKALRAQLNKWKAVGVSAERIDEVLSGKRGYGMSNSLIGEPWEYAKYAVSKFRSSHLRVLDPDGFAPVLMNGCSWIWPGGTSWRPLRVEEYFRIMGFPDDYKMGWPAISSGKYKAYLSKGVCPQVAAWVLDQCKYWFDEPGIGPATETMVAGQVTDLRPAGKRGSAEPIDPGQGEPFAWMEEDE